MRLTFLGTGTSMGVPVIGCNCAICRSPDPRNHRLRTSALIEIDGRTILIDAGPDLRQQALAARIARLDAVLLTHCHADHVAGLDDLRPLNFAQRGAIPLYGTAATLDFVRNRFSYAFSETSQGSTRPMMELVEIDGVTPFTAAGVTVVPFEVLHGTWTITGFRIGGLGYVTDASVVPAPARAHLQDLDVLVLNALRERPHPTHLSLAEALHLAEELRPRQALFVHMNHELDHAATNAALPPFAQLAYDGQIVEIPDDRAS